MKAKNKANTEAKVTSYKIGGGELIRRTEKEQVELDQLKAERYGNPEEGSAGSGAARIKREIHHDCRIASSQIETDRVIWVCDDFPYPAVSEISPPR